MSVSQHYYNSLGRKLIKNNQLLEAIACYHHAISLNLDLSNMCFLDELKPINLLKIEAQHLHIFKGQKTEKNMKEGIVSLQGNNGFVFYGPYINIPDGLYRVRVAFDFPITNPKVSEKKKGFDFDIVSSYPNIIYKTEVKTNQKQLEFYLEFIEAKKTEFRFRASGTAFSVNFIELTSFYEPERNERAAFYYFSLGSLLQFKSKDMKAETAFSKALKFSNDRFVESLKTYQKALPFNPNWVKAYLCLGKVLERKNAEKEAIASYQQAIDIAPDNAEGYYKLAMLLANKGSIYEAVGCFQKSQKQLNGERVYEYIWKGLNQLGSLNEDNFDPELKIDPTEVYEYFKNTSKYTVVEINRLSVTENKIIEKAGLSLEKLKLILADNSNLELIYINSFASTNLTKTQLKVRKKSSFSQPVLNCTNWWQDTLINDGFIYAVCPHNGKIIKTNHSFGFRNLDILSYRFVGEEVFYLLVGNWSGNKIGIYFPRLELLIYNAHQVPPAFLSLASKSGIDELKANIVSYWKLVKEYIEDKNSKKIAAVLGIDKNLGHYFWRYVSGIQHLYANNLLDKVDNFLIGVDSFLDIRSIFPEIDYEKILRMDDNKSLFITILKNNYFAVKVTEGFIPEELALRIYRAAVNKCSKAFLDEVKEAQKHFPLIWINLRSHNKAWLDRVDGYANIIKKIHNEYPNLAVVFDGIAKDKIDAKTIEEKIFPNTNIKIYDAIACPLEETIVYSFYINSYIAVIGSGLTLVTWLANKPGVAHSNIAHLGQKVWWNNVRENAVSPEFINRESILDIDPHHSAYCNYNLDYKVIYDKLIKIIRNLQPQPLQKLHEIKQNFSNALFRLHQIEKKLKDIEEALNAIEKKLY